MANEEVEVSVKSETEMEDLFTSIIFDQSDFIDNWNKIYKVAFIYSLDNEKVLKNKSIHVLNSLEIIIKKLANISDSENEAYIEKEKTYLELFVYVSNEFKKDDIGYNNIEQFISLFQLLSTSHEGTTLFKLLALSQLFFLISDRNYFEVISDSHSEILFKQLMIEMKKERIYCFYDIKNEWCYTIQDFLAKFTGLGFRKNILIIQKFYEFMITHSCEPYNKACTFLIKQVNSDQDLPCPSIYWNLTSKENKDSNHDKILFLINTFTQTILTDNYDVSTMYDFARQIIVLFKYEMYNFGDQAFEFLHIHLYNSFFQIFLTTSNNDSRKIIYFFANNLRQKKSKLKLNIRDEFTLLVLKDLINICNNYFNITGSSKVLAEEQKTQYLDILAEFLDIFCRTLIQVTRNKKHISLCLRLVITMFNLPVNESILGLAALILKKQNFFNNFAKYETEALEVLNSIFDTFEKITPENKDCQALYDRVKDIAINFTNQTCLSQSLASTLYTKCLFNRLVCSPVENRILDANFYKIFHSLDDSLVSFSQYPTQADGFDRLVKVFSIVVSPAVLDQIQPFFTPYTQQPAVYYLQFFRRIAIEINRQQSLETALSKHIHQLVTSLRRLNSFFNLSGEPVINYYILDEFTRNLLNKQNTNEILVDKLISLCIDVYVSNPGFKTVYDTMVTLASLNYPKILAKYAEKLFAFFLKSEDESQYSYQIESIFQYSDSAIFDKLGSNIFAKILRSSRENISPKNMALLLEIARHSGEFYLSKQDDELRLVTLQRLIIKYRQASLINLFMCLVSVVIENLSDNFDEEKIIEVYTNRKKFYSIVFVELSQEKLRFNKEYSIEGIHLRDTLHVLCNLFLFIFKSTDKKIVRQTLIADLIELYAIIHEKECVYIFNTLKKISSLKDQINLLKAHYKTFKLILVDEKDDQICDQLKILCEVIERSSVIMDSQQSLDNGERESIFERLHKEKPLDDRLEEPNGLLEHSWSEELCNRMLENENSWLVVAEKLNFAQEDIENWKTSENPGTAMLNEWFLTNKKQDAISGLIEVFNELGFVEYISLIEGYSEKVQSLSKQSFYDEETDVPQVFISFEKEYSQKAHVLKKNLELLSLNVWIDENKLSSRVNSSNSMSSRLDRGIRACKLFICLMTRNSSNDQIMIDQINTAIRTNKPVIPLLVDSSCEWPLEEASQKLYMSDQLLYKKFFRENFSNDSEETEIYWPDESLNELLFEIKKMVPDNKEELDKNYKKFDVFISYEKDQKNFAIGLNEIMTTSGLSVWIDVEQIGDALSGQKLEESLRSSVVFVSLITLKYMLSSCCQFELDLAVKYSKKIISVTLEQGLESYPDSSIRDVLQNNSLKCLNLEKPKDSEYHVNSDNCKELLKFIREQL